MQCKNEELSLLISTDNSGGTCVDPRKSEVNYGNIQTKSSCMHPLPLKSEAHCMICVWSFILSQKNVTPAMPRT